MTAVLDRRFVGKNVIGPQSGPQSAFMRTKADICIYGGAAGGGKSYGLLLEALRYICVLGFSAVLFRRTYPMITNPGGLWDTSMEIYGAIGAKPKQSSLEWEFSNRNVVRFAHMQHEKNKLDWMGSQLAYIGFDELTHFSKGMFMYMLSRNRSTCGVRPYIRATCNPDSSSWVRSFISWWIDESTGMPIPERDGVLRYMVRENDELVWFDSLEEAIPHCPVDPTTGKPILPKSVTFIKADVSDNKILVSADPGYLANLHALPLFERMQLLKGNWNVRPVAGMFFQRSWFEVVDVPPADVLATVRYWDRAATEATDRTNPDWTAGVKMSKSRDGCFYIHHVERFRARPKTVYDGIHNMATSDGHKCTVWLEQDPGQAGIADTDALVKRLAGYNARINRVTKPKVERWLPLSAQAEAGNVKIVRGAWNETFLTEMESVCDEDQLPPELQPAEPIKKDQADAAAGAFNMLVTASSGSGIS